MGSFVWVVRVKSPFSTILFWIVAFIILDEADPAGVTTASLNHTVQLRKNVPLHRWADGNPAPTITWVQKNSVGRGNKLHFGLRCFTDAGCFTYDRGTGIGERAYLDIAESESRLFNGEMVILNEKLDIGLLNKESEKYQNFSKRIAQVVEDLFKADVNYYATKVIQFESGCAKVYFTLKFKKIVRASIIISALKYAAVDEKFGSFVVDPLSITASQDKTPASSSQAIRGEDLFWIIIDCLAVGLIALLCFMCCSETHKTHSETGETRSETHESRSETHETRDETHRTQSLTHKRETETRIDQSETRKRQSEYSLW